MHRFQREQIKSLVVHKTYKLVSQQIYIQKRAKTIKQFKRRVCQSENIYKVNTYNL